MEKLFGGFPPVPTADWEAVIAADLKGADRYKKLVWRTAEGFDVQPYYRAENLVGLAHLDTAAGQFPFLRGTEKDNEWRVHQTIAVGDAAEANRQALEILDAGCTSVGFCLSGEVDVDVLLKGIVLSAVDVVFCGCGARKVAEKLAGRDLSKANVSFVIDPVIKNLSLKGEDGCCENGTKCFDNINALCEKFATNPGVRVVSVSGHEFGASGSTIVQELAFALSAGKEYLAKGVPADKLRFSFSVTANYFMEIAKFRAARVLWAEIASAKIFAHAVTSRWNQTVYDPYVNMLRGTTEAMSAAVAGVHSLEVTPFDAAFQPATDFSRRIARNVQLLLKHEAHFDGVVDAAGGSYYIENLTTSIAAEARKLIAEVDEKGGYIEAFKSGFVVGQVEASAAAKDKAVATRRTILLGANQYPNFTETADENVSAQDLRPKGCARDCGCKKGGECTCPPDCDCKTGGECTCGKNILRPYRGAMEFEQIRFATDRSGRAPKAFMLTCGTLAMARARAQFACNFFACAGIKVQDNTFFASVKEGAEAAIKSGAEIVVVCAADDDYATVAVEAHKLLPGKIVVVAGAPASQPELEAAGITHFISVRSNVLETLKSYLKEL